MQKGRPACPLVERLDKQHGRIGCRRHWVKDISTPEWNDYAAPYGRQQAIRVERQRQQVKTGKTSREVSYALNSLDPAQATEEQLAALLRNHWEIENGLHYVRDFTYDEDPCHGYVRDLPRTLACLTNAAQDVASVAGLVPSRCALCVPFQRRPQALTPARLVDRKVAKSAIQGSNSAIKRLFSVSYVRGILLTGSRRNTR